MGVPSVRKSHAERTEHNIDFFHTSFQRAIKKEQKTYTWQDKNGGGQGYVLRSRRASQRR